MDETVDGDAAYGEGRRDVGSQEAGRAGSTTVTGTATNSDNGSFDVNVTI